MAITITDKVGQKPPCINLPEDVLKIKKALNQISTFQGGFKESPQNQKMDEFNPIMDEKTLVAIQKFQLKQFGWSGADRRIFPGGQTITRINELLPEEPVTPQIEAKSNIFFIQLSPKIIMRHDTMYMIIDDIQNNQRAKYQIYNHYDPGEKYVAQQRILWKGPPISVKDFDKANFEYITIARPVIYLGTLVFKYVETENELRIKPIGYQSWQKFNTEPYLMEPYFEAQRIDPMSGDDAKYVTQTYIGRMKLIEFEN